MSRLIETDVPSFVRFAIAPVTGGSVDDDHAQAMLARLPTDAIAQGWATLTANNPFADLLSGLTFPHAETIAVTDTPTTSAEFVDALRDFCLSAG